MCVCSPEDDSKVVPLEVPAASHIRLFPDLGGGYSTPWVKAWELPLKHPEGSQPSCDWPNGRSPKGPIENVILHSGLPWGDDPCGVVLVRAFEYPLEHRLAGWASS